MKKRVNIVFIVICMVICVLPFAGMAVYRTDTTTENKTLAAAPKLTKDGSINLEYFEELAAYFEDHFSFRQELVSADAWIQSKIFKVSNVDTVLVGNDGWLFYTDTVDDYLRRNTMTERQAFNTVNNLRLLQEYVTGKGAAFLFTVPPNKNSLYDDNMIYYVNQKAGDVKNIDVLTPKLLEAGISYVDLFEPFEKNEEILYLKRDSHWNNKGAALAYNTILDNLMIEHETYEAVKAVREETAYGDLNTMLYPLIAKPEWDYYYQYESGWSYTSEDDDVEAAWLETENAEGEGNLLMFRDSFGNTLIPLMAEQFEKASFSKATPYRIAEYMEKCEPELVIAEKVERNLDEFMTEPPIMQGPEVEIPEVLENSFIALETKVSGPELGLSEVLENDSNMDKMIHMEESMDDTEYWVVSGELDEQVMELDDRIYIRLINHKYYSSDSNEEEISKTYEAFTTTTDSSDYGYLLYIPKNELQSMGVLGDVIVTVDVIAGKDDDFRLVKTKDISIMNQ